MIDGMDGIESYLRDVQFRPGGSQIIISASGWEARTSRSVEAHGQEERDDEGHPVGTRVVVRFGGGLVGNTMASSSGVLMSGTSSSDLVHTVTMYMPVTEVGAYVSDQIMDDIKFTAGLVVGRRLPPFRAR